MIYQGSGLIKIYGCAIKYFQKRFLVYFGSGERVYIKDKAKKGILESIIIKNVSRNTNEKISYSGFVAVVVYVDTTNRVWLEKELIPEAEAIDYAKIYWQRVLNENQKYIEKYCD